MDEAVTGSVPRESAGTDVFNLSYKFQRLREKLRASIANGELVGKLPGERALAKRFHVNAKTLSKALTDLAAEGLLDRSIGRGTYVKGSGPTVTGGKRWLVLCDADELDWDIIRLLRAVQPDLETFTDVSTLRPSYLSQFGAVIDMAKDTPDAFIRDLVVRNVAVVLVGKEPRIYSTHAVVFDSPLAVAQIGRHLVLSGHSRLAAVEPAQSSVVADNLNLAVPRYAANTSIQSCDSKDAALMVEHGVTAFVCHSLRIATDVKSQLERAGIAVPGRVSVTAVGWASGDPSVTGVFIQRSEKASAIVRLLKDQQSSRPTTIWLAGQFVDGRTVVPSHAGMLIEHDGPRQLVSQHDDARQVM